MHEILTLQLGNYANYVGAHYWNFQDELLGYTADADWAPYSSAVNYDALFSQTEDAKGNLRFRPRVLMVDLNGAQGGVSFSHGAAGQAGSGGGVVSSWDAGQVEVHRQAPVPRSAFIQRLVEQAQLVEAGIEEDEDAAEARQRALEAAAAELDSGGAGGGAGGVRYWTDYLKAELRPSSVATLPGLWLGVHEFGGYGEGLQALERRETLEELLDRVRLLVEACDVLQGLQAWGDDLSGAGGLAQRLLTELTDDLGPGRPILYFSLRPPRELPPPTAPGGAAAHAQLALNEGLALTALRQVVSVYTPLSVPLDASAFGHLRYWPFNTFHSSALCAAAIDNVTLPYRLAGGDAGGTTPLGAPVAPQSMQSMARLITGSGPGLAAVRMALPCGALPHDPQAAAAAADVRTRHPLGARALAAAEEGQEGQEEDGAGQAAAAGGGLETLELAHAASMTPGVEDRPDACLARSLVLRGPRTAAGPASTSAALQQLDALLLKEGRRCVQHRCIAPMPLAVPLPFPRLFRPHVGRHGELPLLPAAARTLRVANGNAAAAAPGGSERSGASAGSSSGSGAEVVTTPVLTIWAASSCWQGQLAAVHARWRQASRTAAGASLLDAWGIASGDASGVEEDLLALSASYDHDSD